MKAAYQLAFIYPAAFALLPPTMDTAEARALMLSIALQESRLADRCQVLDSGARGPARGWYQFEKGGGVAGVLAHATTRSIALKVLDELGYPPDVTSAFVAIEHNDVLATCFARLLLYTLPSRLPRQRDVDGAWDAYIAAWRPGKPHRKTWDAHYERAWALVAGAE